MDSFKYDCLLGTDFITYFNADLQFSTQCITFPNGTAFLEPLEFSSSINRKHHTILATENSSKVPPSSPASPIILVSTTTCYVEPLTVLRIPVSNTGIFGSLNLLEVAPEFTQLGLFVPDILLRQQYSCDLTIPVINPSKQRIKIKLGIPICISFPFDELPISDITLDILDDTLEESTLQISPQTPDIDH